MGAEGHGRILSKGSSALTLVRPAYARPDR